MPQSGAEWSLINTRTDGLAVAKLLKVLCFVGVGALTLFCSQPDLPGESSPYEISCDLTALVSLGHTYM